MVDMRGRTVRIGDTLTRTMDGTEQRRKVAKGGGDYIVARSENGVAHIMSAKEVRLHWEVVG